jgi:hypothetical protein
MEAGVDHRKMVPGFRLGGWWEVEEKIIEMGPYQRRSVTRIEL